MLNLKGSAIALKQLRLSNLQTLSNYFRLSSGTIVLLTKPISTLAPKKSRLRREPIDENDACADADVLTPYACAFREVSQNSGFS